MELLDERLRQEDCANGFIIDGFLRTISQARMLENLFAGSGQELDAVLMLDVGREILVKRLAGRRNCSETGKLLNIHFSTPEELEASRKAGGKLIQREDDKEETIAVRLAIYQRGRSRCWSITPICCAAWTGMALRRRYLKGCRRRWHRPRIAPGSRDDQADVWSNPEERAYGNMRIAWRGTELTGVVRRDFLRPVRFCRTVLNSIRPKARRGAVSGLFSSGRGIGNLLLYTTGRGSLKDGSGGCLGPSSKSRAPFFSALAFLLRRPLPPPNPLAGSASARQAGRLT